MIGVYFTYESRVLNSQGHIYNKASLKFEPKFRVCGLRSPRNARQTSWRKVTKKVIAKQFEEGYPTLMAGRSRYTAQEKVIIYSTPFAIKSVRQAREGFVLEQNSTVKLLPTGLVKAILTKTEQSHGFFKWVTTRHECEVGITEIFDVWSNHAVALIKGEGAFWFFKQQGKWNMQPVGQGITRIINCVKKGNTMIVVGKADPRMVGYSLDFDTFTVTQINLPKEIEALLK
jgi:hypothetical protein